MNIDPELREVAELVKGRGIGPIDVAGARAGLIAMVGQPVADERVEVTELQVKGPSGDPPVRVVVFSARGRPTPSPAVVYLHGGGFIVGAPETEWAVATAVAVATEGVVVSVDYRLAPEHPYPAAVEDSYVVLLWTADHADDLGIDPGKVAVAGSSSGGGLAAALALMARDRSGPAIAFQYLAIPSLDDRLETPSMRSFTDTPMWNRGLSERSWSLYLGERDDVPAYAAPARATDFHGLPPAYIAVSEYDPLRDEGIDYARTLLKAEVSVELHLFPGTFHGSTVVTDAAISRRQVEETAVVLRRALIGADAALAGPR
jgi:acetyl esterase